MKPGPQKGSQRRGGRKKGTPNRASDETRRLIEDALGASPLEKMATLARELLDGERVLLVPVTIREGNEVTRSAEESDAKAIEIATKLLSEIAQYHSPKRKAVEVSGPDGAALQSVPVMVYLPKNGRSEGDEA